MPHLPGCAGCDQLPPPPLPPLLAAAPRPAAHLACRCLSITAEVLQQLMAGGAGNPALVEALQVSGSAWAASCLSVAGCGCWLRLCSSAPRLQSPGFMIDNATQR